MKAEIIDGLVSVVVASYNHANYLEQRMDSLINQTYKNIEILVIDDCSIDGSLEVLRCYQHYSNVKIIARETNEGWVAVSNLGASKARGEYILFANCDDVCDSMMIEKLVKFIVVNSEVGLAFCRSYMIDSENNIIGNDFEFRENKFKTRCSSNVVIDANEMRRFLLHSCVIPNLSAALIRRDAFFRSGGLSFKFKACSDWELFFRIADNFNFAYIAEPLNYFRQHESTIRSATKGRITYDEFFTLLLLEISRSKLKDWERLRFRTHVMYLWIIELIRFSKVGLQNFSHHFQLIYKLDRIALLFIPLAILMRIIDIPRKLVRRIIGKR